MFEKYFKLKANGTTIKTEIIAGITTFLTMAYILAVNPIILSAAGMDKGALFTATAVASIVGTMTMALLISFHRKPNHLHLPNQGQCKNDCSVQDQ